MLRIRIDGGRGLGRASRDTIEVAECGALVGVWPEHVRVLESDAHIVRGCCAAGGGCERRCHGAPIVEGVPI